MVQDPKNNCTRSEDFYIILESGNPCRALSPNYAFLTRALCVLKVGRLVTLSQWRISSCY